MTCEYPCTECEKEKECRHRSKYKKCEPFRKWFREQWRKIQELFGAECVDLTLEEKECDNENS